MKKRWVITGANGYLGGELCRGLYRRGEKVLAVARFGKHLNDLIDVGIQCQTYDDLSLSPGDIFVHCAGKTEPAGSWEDFKRVNVEWPVQLFNQATEKRIACFVYVSSVAALGYMNRQEKGPLKENAEPMLASGELYGRSKLLAEHALHEMAREKTIRLVIFRPGKIYGRRSLVRKQTWFRRGVLVDPLQRIPLLHIDNFLDALYLVVLKTEAEGIYCVVDDEQPPLRELNRKKIELGLMRYPPWQIGRIGFWMLNATRMAIRTIRGQFHTHPKGYRMAEFYFQTRRLLYSTEKLTSLVGWTPTKGLAEGLMECASQYHATQEPHPTSLSKGQEFKKCKFQKE